MSTDPSAIHTLETAWQLSSVSDCVDDALTLVAILSAGAAGWALFRQGSQLGRLASKLQCFQGVPTTDPVVTDTLLPRRCTTTAHASVQGGDGIDTPATRSMASSRTDMNSGASSAVCNQVVPGELEASCRLWCSLPSRSATMPQEGVRCHAVVRTPTSDATLSYLNHAAAFEQVQSTTALVDVPPVGSGFQVTSAIERRNMGSVPSTAANLLAVTRAHGLGRRADLAVDVWLQRCSELGTEPGDIAGSGGSSEFPPAPELYSAALEACAHCGDFESAERAARSAGWRSPPASAAGSKAFLCLIRWLARHQDLNAAVECCDAIRRAGGCIDLPTRRAVLVAAVRKSDMLLASELFHDLTMTCVEPDSTVLSAMVHGYCAVGDLEKAMVHLQMMQQRGIIPDARIFDAMLDACVGRNLPALAEGVLADMEASGARPSNTTLAVLLRLHGHARDVERALSVFEELPKRHNLDVNAHTYGVLISVCLSNGRLDLALHAFEKMNCAGSRANARTYERLITGCLRHGDLENAARLVHHAFDSPSAAAAVEVELQAGPCVHLEPKVVEELLWLVCRRRRASELAAPILARLHCAGLDISECAADAVLRAAAAEAKGDAGPSALSPLHSRRDERQCWRNFSRSTTAEDEGPTA